MCLSGRILYLLAQWEGTAMQYKPSACISMLISMNIQRLVVLDYLHHQLP
jgi:hypothetical protein